MNQAYMDIDMHGVCMYGEYMGYALGYAWGMLGVCMGKPVGGHTQVLGESRRSPERAPSTERYSRAS